MYKTALLDGNIQIKKRSMITQMLNLPSSSFRYISRNTSQIFNTIYSEKFIYEAKIYLFVEWKYLALILSEEISDEMYWKRFVQIGAR